MLFSISKTLRNAPSETSIPTLAWESAAQAALEKAHAHAIYNTVLVRVYAGASSTE